MNANDQPASTASPPDFASLADALAVAAYIEQVLSAEHQWIINRLGWLLISQSFCLTAYAVMVTTPSTHETWTVTRSVFALGLPTLGVCVCVVMGVAILAASREVRELADARARLTKYINERSPARIPLLGITEGLRERRWTLRSGRLPHYGFPWIFAAFWCAVLLGNAVDVVLRLLA